MRRLLNTEETIQQETKNEIIDKFDSKLTNSGYSKEQRRDIIQSGLIGYTRKVERARNENRRLHRSGHETEKARFRKKYIEKYNWQNKKSSIQQKNTEKPKKNNKKEKTQKQEPIEYKSVLFIPRTPGGNFVKG